MDIIKEAELLRKGRSRLWQVGCFTWKLKTFQTLIQSRQSWDCRSVFRGCLCDDILWSMEEPDKIILQGRYPMGYFSDFCRYH